MGFFDSGPPLKDYTAKKMFEILARLAEAINNINEGNFRTKLGGVVLAIRSVPMNTLEWREHVIPLVMAAPNFQTTSTTAVNIGGYFPWDPAKYPSDGGTWHLEADIAIQNVAATAICELNAGAVLKAVTTISTSLTRERSDAIEMPSNATNLWVSFRSSSGSYTATLGGAKLIFIP